MEKAKAKKSYEIKGDDFLELIKIIIFSGLGLFIFFFPLALDKSLASPLLYISEYIYLKNKSFVYLFAISVIFLLALKNIFKKEKTIALKLDIALKIFSVLILLVLTISDDFILFRDENLVKIMRGDIFRLLIFFPVGALFLPLIMEYGVINILDGYFGKLTKSLFKGSGKSLLVIAVFLFVDNFLGYYIIYKLYKEGRLRNSEFINYLLNFPILKITLASNAANKLSLNKIIFTIAYLFIFIVVNFIICRIYPAKNFKRSFFVKGKYKERYYRRDKLRLSIVNYLESRKKKSLLKHAIEYFNEAVNIVANLLPIMFFSFLVADFVINFRLALNLLEGIYYIFFSFVKLEGAYEASHYVALAFLNPKYAIGAISGPNIDSMSSLLIGVILVCQGISLTSGLVFLRGYARDISYRDIFLIYIERIVLISIIISFIYYCYLGFSI